MLPVRLAALAMERERKREADHGMASLSFSLWMRILPFNTHARAEFHYRATSERSSPLKSLIVKLCRI